MTRLVWDESFSVKVDEIDRQHRRWIEIIDELHEAMTAPGGGQMAERVLGELREHAAFHFRFEEEYLRQIGYPGLGRHRRQHRQFLETIAGGVQADRRGGPAPDGELIALLHEWLRDHIRNEDRKYVLFGQAWAN